MLWTCSIDKLIDGQLVDGNTSLNLIVETLEVEGLRKPPPPPNHRVTYGRDDSNQWTEDLMCSETFPSQSRGAQ